MSSDRPSRIPLSLKAGMLVGFFGVLFGILIAVFSTSDFVAGRIHFSELLLIPFQCAATGFTFGVLGALVSPLHRWGTRGDILAGILCANGYTLVTFLFFMPEDLLNPDPRIAILLGIMGSGIGGWMGWSIGREYSAETLPNPPPRVETVPSPEPFLPKLIARSFRYWPAGFDFDLFLLNALIAWIPVLIAATRSSKGRTFAVGSLSEFWISFRTLAIMSTLTWLIVNVLALPTWRWHDIRSLGWRFGFRYAFVNLGISWLILLSVCLFTVLVFGLEQWFRAAS